LKNDNGNKYGVVTSYNIKDDPWKMRIFEATKVFISNLAPMVRRHPPALLERAGNNDPQALLERVSDNEHLG
jgi:hypothetical protein